ncbi:MAG: thioredoxin family protein [Bacteroidetes bacterium]|nr:thioredoxin family protein [Bacteroidota bacterium]
MKKQIIFMLLMSIVFGSLTFAQSKKAPKKKKTAAAVKDTSVVSKPIVTFIELGSVNCIPCKAMQPIMKSLEIKYAGQLKIVFHDVWKQDQAHFAQVYKIRLIPTQVFLDADGKEIMRHEGFFPEKEIDAFLQSKGLKVLK